MVYCRPIAADTFTGEASGARVDGPDGGDRLERVEWIHFADRRVPARR